MKKNLKNKGRKLYKKPLIEEVELKPEEAVLTGCKVSQNDVGPSAPAKCRITGGCQGLGS